MKRSFICGLSAIVGLLLASSAQGATVLYANVTLDQEPGPPVPTTVGGAPRALAFGTAIFTVNDAMDAISMVATVYNIDVTGTQTADANDNLVAAHIHASATPFTPPATAGVVWGFFGAPFNNNTPNDQVNTPFTTGVGGTFTGTWNLPEGNNTTLTAQLPNVLAGRSYINFHTTQFGGGEIRGAINAVPEPSSVILFGIGIAGVMALRRRWA